MNELVDWLRAQLDEDARVAEEALHPDAVQPGSWSADRYADDPDRRHVSEDKAGHYWSVAHQVFAPIAEHVARHDPARVLREVAAKRAIVDEHEHRPASPYVKMYPDRGEQPFGCRLCADNDGLIWPAGWCRTLRLLASAYEDRPGYREEWRP